MNSVRGEHFPHPDKATFVSTGSCGAAPRKRPPSKTHVESRAWRALQKQEVGTNTPVT